MSDLVWTRDGIDWPNRRASEFIDAANIRWHVQRMGQGAPLLLVHGMGAATNSWGALMPLLAENFSVVALDLPGHGFTQMPLPHRLSLPDMASDLAQLLRVINFNPDIVVGHSAGAAILARMCLGGKIAPRLLVSLNGAFFPFGGAAASFFSPLAKFLVLNPLVPRMFAWQASDPAAVARLIAGTGSRIDQAGIAQYSKLVRSPSHVAGALRMMANWKLEPLVQDLPKLAPTLVLVAADNDLTISPRVAQRVHGLVPGSVLKTLHGLGHLAHEERPDLVAQIIMSFAAQTKTADENIGASVI